jgi:hypothetical protein
VAGRASAVLVRQARSAALKKVDAIMVKALVMLSFE